MVSAAKPREHIVYTHPAGGNGFRYFYIAYTPGEKTLYLRYRREPGEPQEIGLGCLDMAIFLSRQRAQPNEEWPFEVTDRAVRTLNLQLQQWRVRAER